MDWGFKAWKAQPLFKKGQVVDKVPVQLGSDREIALVEPKNLAVILPRTASANITVKLVYDGPIKAPISKGQEIARSEEHTSELQSLMRQPYAVFSLKNKNKTSYFQPII